MIGTILCRLGRHQRSRGSARRAGDGWVSKCRRCGVAMRRSADGVWSVEQPPAADPPPGAEASTPA